ncbi:hypothetical protein N9A58_09860, partial [Opitutales bacterium]|nr:hypothetical protein [Opitutales bacterium]
LKTASTFDYETNASVYTITVQAKDELNATTEGNFTVTLEDVDEDTDGDGFRDFLEASTGSDLNDPNSTPLQRGLVAWYPFDGNASDMSGNGNHGTVYGATLGTDRHGAADKAYSFDGVDDYINLGNSLLPTNGDDWTASMWVNNPRANSTHGLLLAQYNGGAGRFQFFSDGDYKLSIFSSNMTGSTELPGFSLGMQENWNLLHLISLGNKISLYENGILRVSDVTIADIAETDTMIGNDGNAGRWLIGSIDDVRIYDRALFEEEIQLLYEDEAELPEQSVTSAKISPALSDLIDGNGSLEQALPAGSVIARKPGEAPPPGYTLFQRNEYNASLVWEEKAPLSMARYAFDGADVIDGKIYFTGMVGGDGSPGSTLLERYDPATNSWETLANRPKPRYAPCTTVLNGKYYVMGGRLDDGIVEVYDPVTNSWSEGEPMPVQVNHCSAVTYAGKIYVIGNNRAIAFDLSSNEWSLMAESGLTTYGTCLAIYEDRIWSFTEEGVESYDPLTDTWQTESSPSVNRQFGTTWTYDGKLYFACGRISGTAKYNTIESYDPKNQNWVKIGEFVDKREVLDSVLIDDRVYLVGGHAITINGNEHVSSMFSAQLPLVHPMNLYFKEGNATAEAELSTLGLADGSVTLGQLAPDALAKIGLDHNPVTAEGSLLAIPRGSQPPPG